VSAQAQTFPQAAPLRGQSLVRFAWLSIAAALITITLKSAAYLLTGSVGLMSDALESVVNLVAAVGALIALVVADREPNEEFAYGFAKAEYFSSGLEGALILVAAIGIAVTSIPRLISPQPIGLVGWGLAVSSAASVVNLLVALRLLRAGRDHQSITLEADARHLLTDVWTSVGVVAGVALVALSGQHRLDAVVALLVAANIVWTGVGLMRRSAFGLLDRAVPPHDRAAVQDVLERYAAAEGARWHALRTRQAGRRRFVAVHILVPGDWSVQRGHQLLEEIEQDVRAIFPPATTTVFTHLESLDDPASYEDTSLGRITAV